LSIQTILDDRGQNRPQILITLFVPTEKDGKEKNCKKTDNGKKPGLVQQNSTGQETPKNKAVPKTMVRTKTVMSERRLARTRIKQC
jgi:hypothetical protein